VAVFFFFFCSRGFFWCFCLFFFFFFFFVGFVFFAGCVRVAVSCPEFLKLMDWALFLQARCGVLIRFDSTPPTLSLVYHHPPSGWEACRDRECALY